MKPVGEGLRRSLVEYVFRTLVFSAITGRADFDQIARVTGELWETLLWQPVVQFAAILAAIAERAYLQPRVGVLRGLGDIGAP